MRGPEASIKYTLYTHWLFYWHMEEVFIHVCNVLFPCTKYICDRGCTLASPTLPLFHKMELHIIVKTVMSTQTFNLIQTPAICNVYLGIDLRCVQTKQNINFFILHMQTGGRLLLII